MKSKLCFIFPKAEVMPLIKPGLSLSNEARWHFGKPIEDQKFLLLTGRTNQRPRGI